MPTYLAGLTAVALISTPAAAASIEGLWRNPSSSVIIDISQCGDSLCGTVKWASAKAQQDARKGTSQLIGEQLLTNLEAKGSSWRGKLFVPDQKMRVNAKVQLVSDQVLKVSGCAMGKALCKSQLWTRTDGPLPSQD